MNLLHATSVRQFLPSAILFFDWKQQSLGCSLKDKPSFSTNYALLNNRPISGLQFLTVRSTETLTEVSNSEGC